MKVAFSFLQSWAAIVTWLVVFGLTVVLLSNATNVYSDLLPEAVVLQISYLVLMLLATNDGCTAGRTRLAQGMLLGMLLLSLTLGWLLPIDYLLIYTIIWIALVPHHFSFRASVFFLVAVNVVWYLIQAYVWEDNAALTQVLLFGTFHIFAFMSSVSTARANRANEHSQELNRELMATQHLLAEASRQTERTRIARDLHDLLGHHLTALTINLQVAGRLSDGEAKEKIDECHALSKLLLSDVREAVTTIREESHVNFTETLKLIVGNVPQLKINLDIDPDLQIDDVNIAEALLRCVQEAITNTLRHSNAKESWVRVWREDHHLRLSIRDDGRTGGVISPGNGLKGMRERIEKLNGSVAIEAIRNMSINVQIPLTDS